jgi:hypothetical protein
MVGDKVSVTYLSSKAVYVTSPDKDRPPVASSRSVEVDSKDGKPRKFTVDIVEKTSTVVENLENVKVGDQLVYQFTEAVAVDITKVEE